MIDDIGMGPVDKISSILTGTSDVKHLYLPSLDGGIRIMTSKFIELGISDIGQKSLYALN